MKHNRKWLVFLLCAMMLVNTFGITAMAAENESPIELYVSPAADMGSIQVQVLADQAQTVADGKLVFTYDADVLTYTGVEAGDAWSDSQLTLSVNAKAGKLILAFANADAAAKGVLFTLRFDAATGADTAIALDGSSYITGVSASLAQQVSTCPSVRFADLGSLFPEAHEAVDFMVANGYMNGMAQTAFGPHVELNRAMMVTILYRIAGNPAVDGTPAFTDVPAGEFYSDAVVWATSNGITNGVTEKLFAPGRELTRTELVTFLYRFAGVMGYDRSASTDLSGYTDAAEILDYADEAFSWAVAAGVIKGTTETTLDPMATTTRAQICLMVYRLLSAQE